MTRPQVKQRTGMIIGSPVRLLALLACTTAELLLGQLEARVVDEERAVGVEELFLEFVVAGKVDDATSDGGADRVGLAHDAAALDVDLDVEFGEFLVGDGDGLEDLEPSDLGHEDLDGDAVDAQASLALSDDGARD